VIIMREQLNVKQKQAISETPAKDGGGLVETCFSSLGRMVAFQVKRPWLGCCLQGSVLIECDPCRLDHQSCKTPFPSLGHVVGYASNGGAAKLTQAQYRAYTLPWGTRI
jgi:hypothetical protein